MSEQRFEITWANGHVETITATDVAMPTFQGVAHLVVCGGEPMGGSRHLMLLARLSEIRTVRNVTAGEPIPLDVPAAEAGGR